MPSRARLEEQAVDLPFAPTSTPRVGSSSISSRGSVSSHFPSRTFCWFPPESVATGTAASAHGSAAARSRPRRCASSRDALGRRRRNSPRARRHQQVLAHAASEHEPLPLAVGRYERDAGADRVARRPAARPSDRRARRRRSARCRPKSVSSNSVLPAPTSPASPTISPRATSRSTASNAPARDSPRVRSTTSPSCCRSLGIASSSARPTISPIRRRAVEPGRPARCRRCGRRAAP